MRPGQKYSSVDFLTNEGKNIATWIPDMGSLLWHNKAESPNGRTYGARAPGGYTLEDIAHYLVAVDDSILDRKREFA